jgi:hypothetical protein
MEATIYLIRPTICYEPNDVYVGATTYSLKKRFAEHKCAFNREDNRYSVVNLFTKYGHDNLEIIELEKCNVENKKDREQHWIDKFCGVNVRRANCPKEILIEINKKSYLKNIEKRLQYAKEYYEKDKEAIAERMKTRYENSKVICEICGGTYSTVTTKQHLKSKRHEVSWINHPLNRPSI